MGPPAAYAIGLMVGSNNTLVSLGLRGRQRSTKFVVTSINKKHDVSFYRK